MGGGESKVDTRGGRRISALDESIFGQVISKKFKGRLDTYDNLGSKCKDLFPVRFDGFKFSLSKYFPSDVKESCTLSLFSNDDNYNNWIRYHLYELRERRRQSWTEWISNPNPHVDFNHSWNSYWEEDFHSLFMKTGVVMRISNNRLSSTNITLDGWGEGYSASAKCNISQSQTQKMGTCKLQVLKAITSDICVGAEIILGDGEPSLTICGRLTEENDTVWCGHIGTDSLGLSYYRQLSPTLKNHRDVNRVAVEQVHCGVEISRSCTSEEGQMTTVALGSRYYNPLTKNDTKVMFDINGTIVASFEKPLSPSSSISLLTCLTVNVFKGIYRIGLGFSST